MNVLSLFDGMSCGQIALNRAGIAYDRYYASEVDKWAIKVTQKNYPDTIQIGDVTQVKAENLPEIDLLLGGSPCQGFSKAGKGLNFDDPRSRLFFEYVRLLKETQPRWFLFENVVMRKEWQEVITSFLGASPIKINSALVSAQSRDRLYWTNISGIVLPDDKGIFLKDIIEDGCVDRDKSYAIDANYYKGGSLKGYRENKRRQIVLHQSEKRLMVCVGMAEEIKGADIWKRVYDVHGKAPTLTGSVGGHHEPKIALDEATWRKLTPLECERLQTVPEGYTEGGVSNTQRYKMLGNGWTVDVIAHILGFVK